MGLVIYLYLAEIKSRVFYSNLLNFPEQAIGYYLGHITLSINNTKKHSDHPVRNTIVTNYSKEIKREIQSFNREKKTNNSTRKARKMKQMALSIRELWGKYRQVTNLGTVPTLQI